MTKYISWTLIVIIIAGLVAWRLGVFESPEAKKTTQSSLATQALPVSVKILKGESIQKKIKATGTVLADESVELTTETSGMITGIYFDEGDKVQKGALLARINDADLRAEMNKVRKEIELAKIQLKRYSQLLENEAVSRSEYDQAQTQLLTLKADSALTIAKIRKTELRAPFSGKIGLRNISPGAYVISGTSIATLVNDDELKIQFAVAEQYAQSVKEGQVILFNTSADKTQRSAKIYAVNPLIDEATRTIEIRAKYDNSKDSIKAGAFANIEVVLGKKDNALKVPAQAVALELGAEKIYVIEDGKCKSLTIKTGIRSDSQIEIVSGAEVGDSVITSGIVQLREGRPVKAVSKSVAL